MIPVPWPALSTSQARPAPVLGCEGEPPFSYASLWIEMRISPVWTFVFLAAFCPFAHGQNTAEKEPQANEAKGMPPRSSPADYPAHANAGTVTIAAEFMGHSVPRPEGPLSTADFVVVETGLFGPAGERLQMEPGDFSLRINGKKSSETSVPYGLVVSSLKDPQWVSPEEAEAKKSKSNGGFSTGGQATDTLPPVVHVPIELQRAMAQYLRDASLPEGERALPEAGLIYFQFRGKTKNIHSLELIYSGPAGKATLPLQP